MCDLTFTYVAEDISEIRLMIFWGEGACLSKWEIFHVGNVLGVKCSM